MLADYINFLNSTKDTFDALLIFQPLEENNNDDRFSFLIDIRGNYLDELTKLISIINKKISETGSIFIQTTWVRYTKLVEILNENDLYINNVIILKIPNKEQIYKSNLTNDYYMLVWAVKSKKYIYNNEKLNVYSNVWNVDKISNDYIDDIKIYDKIIKMISKKNCIIFSLYENPHISNLCKNMRIDYYCCSQNNIM